MNLQSQISSDIKSAMLAKDPAKVGVLRMLKANISNTLIEKKTQDLEDNEVISLVRKSIKTRQDSIEAFTKGNRPDLVEKETAEIKILESYLPQSLSNEELETIVQDAIKETGATSKKEMGSVMKIATAKAAGRADGKTLSTLVAKLLA